jgi:hypothetical protein
MLRTRQFRGLHPAPQAAQHACIARPAANRQRKPQVAACQHVSSSDFWELQRSWLSKAVAGAVSLSLLFQVVCLHKGMQCMLNLFSCAASELTP